VEPQPSTHEDRWWTIVTPQGYPDGDLATWWPESIPIASPVDFPGRYMLASVVVAVLNIYGGLP